MGHCFPGDLLESDGFGVEIGHEAMLAAFSATATLLVAAEGCRGDVLRRVDVDHPCFKLTRDTECGADV